MALAGVAATGIVARADTAASNAVARAAADAAPGAATGATAAADAVVPTAAGTAATPGDTARVRTAWRRPGDSLYVVAPIVVRAPWLDPRYEAEVITPGFLTRVDLASRRDRMETLGDVLGGLAGVHVRDYGGLGAFATVSIRGASAGQVAVYLDGVPVADPYTGIVNLSDLPLGGVERIDVYRGFAPATLGNSAIGGVIHLVSDAGASRAGTRARATATYGSLDTAREQLTLRVRPSGRTRWRLRVHALAEHTRGDFTFHDDNGTPLNPADDDPDAVRVNNDRRAWNASLRLDVDVHARTRSGVSLIVDRFDRTQGVPGLGANPSTTARSARRRTLGQVVLRTQPLPAARFDARLYASRIGDRFRDRDGDVALGGADTDNRIDVRGGRLRGALGEASWPVRGEVVFDWRRETFHPRSFGPIERDGPDTWRHWNTLAVSARLAPRLPRVGRRVVVDATWRTERLVEESFSAPPLPWLPPSPTGRVRSSADSPSIGVRVRLADGLLVKGSFGRYLRPPTFLERFGDAGLVTGNADLVPERGVDRSVGVALRRDALGPLARVFAELVRIDNRVEDLILFFPNSQLTSRPVNIGSARIRGWEATLGLRTPGAIDVTAAWTHLDTEDTSAIPYYRGNDLPARPRDEVTVRTAWHRRAWRVTLEAHWIAANWLDRANRRRTPARRIVDVSVRVPSPLQGLGITLEGRNVTNDRVSDVAGFPLPGRLAFATLSWGIH